MAVKDKQLAHKANILRTARRVVIKVGSNILSKADGVNGVNLDSVTRLAREIAALHAQKKEIVLVSSGAVAAGMSRLGMQTERSRTIPTKQAAAAVGQIALMALYEQSFSVHGAHVGQILLTHDDVANRQRYLNAKHTMLTLLDARVIPIVNENDSVAVEEIEFGDNDNLSALVAVLIEADVLVILSDVEGLYDKDPRTHADAQLVSLVERCDEELSYHAGGAGPLGRGGMTSKLQAARKAALCGIPTIVADGRKIDSLGAVFSPTTATGTVFLPVRDRLASRKHWIAYTLKPAGALRVDAGAANALRQAGRSLLPPGVYEVHGIFGVGDCVACLDANGHEFARGLVNYSSAALEQIKGLKTTQIEQILGHKVSDEVIHRDDLALL
jgi:glutamate 5-kinase